MALLSGCLIAATQVAELLLWEKDLAAGIQEGPNPTDGLRAYRSDIFQIIVDHLHSATCYVVMYTV